MPVPRLMFPILLIMTAIAAASSPLSDTLFIEGHYSQGGKRIKRGDLESFLEDRNTSALYIDRARGFRWSSWAVGAPMWCVNIGYTIYQANKFVEAVKRQEPPSGSFSMLSMPLVIGLDVTVIVQDILNARSGFNLHRAVVMYNSSIRNPDIADTLMNHRIRSAKGGGYFQDRAWFSSSVLYPVLKENPRSRSLAWWSDGTNTAANQSFAIGGMYIAFAAFRFMDPENTDRRARNRELGIGIGAVSFGIINAIVSSSLRKKGILRYNESVQ